jgi:uncharacterized protein
VALSLLHPGVYIEEVPSGVRTIQGVATSIALFIGWAPKGSTERPVRIGSFADYAREFGGLHADSPLSHAVMHFFANGGADAYVVRLVDNLSATPAKPAELIVSSNLELEATSKGEWGETFQISITKRADDGTRFRIDVKDALGDVVETFQDLSMTATDPRFPPNVVNGRSAVVTVRKATNAAAPPSLATDPSPLTGGEDGKVLVPGLSDFANEFRAKFVTGTPITVDIPLLNLVCAPGVTDASTLLELQKLCHARRAFLIMDSPKGAPVSGTTGMEEFASNNSGLVGSNAVESAIFYPWVRATDPLTGAVADFPPCGFVAGIFARTDSSRGVWKAPAGSDASVNGALGFERTLSDRDSGLLNPLGINCLRTLPVYGNVVWGSRTLHGQNDRGSEWKYIPVRRLALFLEESLFRGTQWVVFEPNDEPLWAQIRLNVGAFMNDLFRQGAFQGKSPKEAYFVRCDRTTTTQADIDLGRLNIHVGFAPLKPAEFVVLRIQQIAGELAT